MSSSVSTPGSRWRTPLVVLAAGCVISFTGFGIRSVFGLFLEPMSEAQGWGRETFALAMAIQNLLWGLAVPIAGALGDRFGLVRVIAFGAVVYAIGIWGMAGAQSPLALHVFGGLLTGTGVAFTAFSLAMVAMAKVVGPQRRTMALGLGTAAGSMGQVVFSPLTAELIASYGWNDSLLILAGTSLIILPLALLLPAGGAGKGAGADSQTMGQAVGEAMGHRGYVLLTLGFFVCGFHVAFIGVHFFAYVGDLGFADGVGAAAFAIIGGCNIIGSFASGIVGQRYSKRASLSAIYFLRAIVITALMLAPKTEFTIYAFAACMGLLWLSTVPLTTGIVAQVFGMRYLATLSGIVFFSHQVGSFLGVWLGGWIYDATGSYDPVWWAGVFFGLAAAVVHLPIDEKPLPRLAGQAA